MLLKFQYIHIGQRYPFFGLLEFLHIFCFEPYRYKVIGQSAHSALTGIYQLLSELLIGIIRETAVLQCKYQPHLLTEDIFGQGFCFARFIAVLVFSEILEITAVIEYQETALALIFAVYAVNTGKVFAKSCTSAYHLPEFRF